MSRIQRYKATHGLMYNGFEMAVEVDRVKLNEVLPELFEFWGVEEENDNEGLEELLKKLAATVYNFATKDWLTLKGILEAFKIGEEGWPNMDGSWGIQITKVEYYFPDSSDFELEEIES